MHSCAAHNDPEIPGEESELQAGWHNVLDKMVPDKNDQAELMVEYGMVRV